MNRILIVLIICSVCALSVFGQKTDTVTKKHFPRHYFSINPFNCALFDQAGLAYEYKPGIFGFGLAAGYKYASKRNYTRLFIAKSKEEGAFEFYSGLYIIPQFNVYLYKPRTPEKGALLYFSLKGVYKYLHVDSSEYHIWWRSGGDSYYFYRKQVDNANILGAFLNLGIKAVFNHFFFDINVGPGLMFRRHKMVVAGEGQNVAATNTSNVYPPRKETFSSYYPTLNISINIGGTY